MEQRYYKVDPNNAVGEIIEEEAIIINLNTGDYFSSLGCGALIWKYLEQGASIEMILKGLSLHYGDLSAVDSTSVESFIKEIIANNLVSEIPKDRLVTDGAPPVAEGLGTSFVAPVLTSYSDMQNLLLLDPIHEVDAEQGWPVKKS